MNNRVIIGGVVVLVLLAVGWWLTTPAGTGDKNSDRSSGDGPVAAKGETDQTAGRPSTMNSGEEVSVADQVAGESVLIASVTLNQMGWVAVRDEDGRVLGAARLDAGSWENVTVPLLRGTTAQKSYQVLLYVDDGDRAFDLHKDILITDAGGGVAGTTFRTF